MNIDLERPACAQGSHPASQVEPQGSAVGAAPGSYDPGSGRSSDEPAAPSNRQDPTTPDDVIDVAAVARLLHVGRNTVYALAARNAIPHRRLGKHIRFHRLAVMRWLASWSLQGAKEGQ